MLLVEVVIREFSFWLFYIKMSSPNNRRSSLFPLAWWWYHCVAISLGTGSLFRKRVKKSRGEKSDVNQSCHQSVFSPIGACIRIRCTASTVERRSQMFFYRLAPFSFPLFAIFSPFSQTESLLTGYVAIMITGGLSLAEWGWFSLGVVYSPDF